MKRRIFQLCLFLLLGAILNVAVAWGLAIYGPPRIFWGFTKVSLISEHRAWRAEVNTAFGSTFMWTVPSRATVTAQSSQVPSWSYAATTPTPAGSPSNDRFVQEEARGWPMLSLFDRSVYDRDLPRNHEEGKLVMHWPTKTQRINDVVVLPYSIIWPGFAINTIFYAAILSGGWLPFAALLGAFRRRRRIKRGLCPTCAYDLRGSASQTCPECGAKGPEPS